MIQLRVRTEFSFKQAYGPLTQVAAALKAIGTPAAGMVDPSTWGHVRWAAACDKASIRPLFGTEVVVPQSDGRRPIAWVLATDTKAFYQFSTDIRAKGANVLE